MKLRLVKFLRDVQDPALPTHPHNCRASYAEPDYIIDATEGVMDITHRATGHRLLYPWSAVDFGCPWTTALAEPLADVAPAPKPRSRK